MFLDGPGGILPLYMFMGRVNSIFKIGPSLWEYFWRNLAWSRTLGWSWSRNKNNDDRTFHSLYFWKNDQKFESYQEIYIVSPEQVSPDEQLYRNSPTFLDIYFSRWNLSFQVLSTIAEKIYLLELLFQRCSLFNFNNGRRRKFCCFMPMQLSRSSTIQPHGELQIIIRSCFK